MKATIVLATLATLPFLVAQATPSYSTTSAVPLPSPPQNPGFELGTTQNWAADYSLRDSGWQSTPLANQLGSGPVDASWSGFSSTEFSVASAGIAPLEGQFSCCIGDLDGDRHRSRLSQSFCIPNGSCYATVGFDWAALVPDAEGHSESQQPYFAFKITHGGEVLVDEEIPGNDASGDSTWTPAGIYYGDESTIWLAYGSEAVELSDASSGTVTVTVEVADCDCGAHGAAAFIDNLWFTTLPRLSGRIPQPVVANVFSPNGDGINDVWSAWQVSNTHDVHIEVRNRWGRIVHEEDITRQVFNNATVEFWDGLNANGNPLKQGTYFYVVTFSNCDSERVAKGTLTLF